jgi:hypothetical protein
MRADAVATKPFKAMRAALDPLVQVDNANTKATPAICEHCSMCRISRSEKIEQSSQGFNVYLRNKQGGFDVNTASYCSGSDNADWAGRVSLGDCEAKCTELNCKCFDWNSEGLPPAPAPQLSQEEKALLLEKCSGTCPDSPVQYKGFPKLLPNSCSHIRGELLEKLAFEKYAAENPKPPSCIKATIPVNKPVLRCECRDTLLSTNEKPNAYANIVAYSTNESAKYLGYLYNSLNSYRSLKRFGSTAEYVVLIHFKDQKMERIPEEELLLRNGIKVLYMENDELIDSFRASEFRKATMYKTYPWCMFEYRAVQMMDSDMLPLRNMDNNFEVGYELGTSNMNEGANSGYALVYPSCSNMKKMRGAMENFRGQGDGNAGIVPEDTGWLGREEPFIETNWAEKNLKDKADCDANSVKVGNPTQDGLGRGWAWKGGQSSQGFFYYYFRYLSPKAGIALTMDLRCVYSNGKADGLVRRKEGDQIEKSRTINGYFFYGVDYKHFTGTGEL